MRMSSRQSQNVSGVMHLAQWAWETDPTLVTVAETDTELAMQMTRTYLEALHCNRIHGRLKHNVMLLRNAMSLQD